MDKKTKIATEQHDWMIQVKDPVVDGRHGVWEDYWGVSTWGKSRPKALKKASESIRQQSRVKRRWRLIYKGVRSINPMKVPANEP